MPLERLEDLALEVAPPIVHAARPLHGAGAEQQPCPPLAPGISGGCGGGAPGAAPPPTSARRGGPPAQSEGINRACPRRTRQPVAAPPTASRRPPAPPSS